MVVTDWTRYAPYFFEAEFRCKHTGRCEMQQHYLDVMLAIRLAYGKRLHVLSGFRDPSHPEERKKPKPGEHTLGVCGDYAVSGIDAIRLLKVALDYGISRVGIRQDNRGVEYLHLGVGAPGLPNPAIWSY